MTPNIIKCGGSGSSNTGVFSCEFNPSYFGGAILVPASTEWTYTELQAFDATLKAMAKADNPQLRAYPIKTFEGLNDNTTEDTTSETSFGTTFKTRDGKTILQYQLNNGLSSWANAESFDNQHKAWKVIYMEPTANGIMATKKSNGMYSGFSLDQLSVKLPTWNNGSDPFNYMITFGHSSKAELKNFTFVQFDEDNDVMDISGLLDINLNLVGAISGAGVATVQAISGGTDLYDVYSTNLAQVTAWVAKDKTTGTLLTVTPVAVTGGTAKTWDVTIDISGLTSGSYITLEPASPSVLEASPITMPGFAGGSITIQIP